MGIPGNLVVRPLGLVAAAGVAVSCLLGGCDGGASTPRATSGCSAVPGVNPRQITLGLLYSANGASATALQPYRAGIDARLGVANANGGVNGRTIDYTWADDQGLAQSNLAAAQQLVDGHRAFAIQEFSLSPGGSASWLNSQGIPVVGTSDTPVWTQYRNMFSSSNAITTQTDSVTTWGEYAKGQGVKKVAILRSNLAGDSPAIGVALRRSFEAYDIPTVTVNAEPSKTVDVPAVVRAIQASGADLIAGFLDPAEFIQIVVEARAVMPEVKILSLTGYDPGLFVVGRQLAGMAVALSYTPFERPVPASKSFLKAMAEYSPQQQPAANELALIGWVDADLMLRGLEVAGACPTRQSFITNLRAVRDYSADGLLAGPVDMNTIFGKLATCYWILRISPEGNRFIPVGTKALCGRHIP